MARLRRATLDDVPTLVAHRRGLFIDTGGFTRAQLDAADPIYRRWIRQRMRSGHAALWIIEERGEIVASGCVWLKRMQPRPDNATGIVPYLMAMYTKPTHRGKGHATRIVKAALKWCKDEGYSRLELHASRFGRPVYEKLGFEPTTEMRKRTGLARPSSRASKRRARSG